MGASGASVGGLALPRFGTSGLQAWEGTDFFSESPGLGNLSQETDRVGEGVPSREMLQSRGPWGGWRGQ